MSCDNFPKKIESCSGGIFKGMQNEAALTNLWLNNHWPANDVSNAAWYVGFDVEKTELILRTASRLGISYMDICQLIEPKKPLII